MWTDFNGRSVAIRESTSSPWVPFPTEMATQSTYQHTQRYRTQQTMLAAGATVSANVVTPAVVPADPPPETPPN